MAATNLPVGIFYVYALFRLDGRIFYIGKGQGNRWLDHEKRVRPGKSWKDNIVWEILQAGKTVPKLKVAEHFTAKEANSFEKMMIRVIGRYPHGPLVNLTAGGEGDLGHVQTADARAKHAAANRKRTLSEHTKEKIRFARLKNWADPQYRERMTVGRFGPKSERNPPAPRVRNRKRKEPQARIIKSRPSKPPKSIPPITPIPKQKGISIGFTGRKHTKETKELLRIMRTGRKHKDETKEKLRIIVTGIKRTDEAKAKMSKAKIGNQNAKRRK